MQMLAVVAKQFAFTDLEVSLKNNGADLGWFSHREIAVILGNECSFFPQTHNNVNYNDLKCSRLYIRRQLP